ncbi:MAG TPA: hypothetical protein VF028_00245 [Actinomycetota bacterium]|jgi:acyl dehydratase|nr:hypothetical protein [Actinomycetota bacterium]
MGVTRGATLATEIDAAVWTAIAVVAGMSFGTLVYLGSRIDALATRLDARIDSGFARVNTRFDAMEARFDAVTARLDAHLEQHAG